MVRILTSVFLTVAVLLIPFGPFHGVVPAKHLTKSVNTRSQRTTMQGGAAVEIALASATPADGGILLQWRTDSGADNPGFYVYRILDRRITLGTRIPGPVASDGGYSYRWFDPNGTPNSIYYIESINVKHSSKVQHVVVPVSRSDDQSTESSDSPSGGSGDHLEAHRVKESPASLAGLPSQLPESAIDNQWGVAAQAALKIQVKSDGWYRVTQQQMSAAGFNPTVDIRNLSLFGNGQEIAIRTSKDAGQLISGDYIEFYGQGLDTADTDTRIYYLIAGTTAGKRAQGDLHIERPLVSPLAQQLPSRQTRPFGLDLTYRAWFASLLNLITGEKTASARDGGAGPVIEPPRPNSSGASPSPAGAQPPGAPAPPRDIARREEADKMNRDKRGHDEPLTSALKAVPAAPPKSDSQSKKRKSHRHKSHRSVRNSMPRYSHAPDQAVASVLSFDDTLQIKERFNYDAQLSNGHNFFGATMGTTFPLTETLSIHNIQSSADGPARLEISLQGISVQSHVVNILFNNVMIGTMSFSGRDRLAQTFTIPVSQLSEGDNKIKFAPVGANEFLAVDYIRLTYPHSYRAYNDSLRFSLRSTQSLKVDGFSTPNVRLIDVTDPTTVKVTRPIVAPSGSGYAITVAAGPRAKTGRTMYALTEGQFQTPAGFSLNQPSTLNQSGNGADLLIVSYKDFIPSLAPLVTQRQNQGLTVQTVDIEDVYDEFSFGAHSPQALQDFLLRAGSHWAKTPRYVLLAGDASYDSRGHRSEAMVRANGGCTDTNKNASDFALALFGNAHNSVFGKSDQCGGSSGGVVISQIYTGLGEAGGSYSNSFIELFNSNAAPVNVNGWSVQYASATGTDWQVTNLSNITIQPYHYYLVQEAGFGGVFNLPTPDAIGNISMGAVTGKVALVNSTTALAGACPTGGGIVDFVGYGSAANCFEGAGPTPVPIDFVPTQQIDTGFGAACTDDGLADFDGDGVPEIPVGRLPASTPAEADLMVSKIVHFSKANVPQKAMLVADTRNCDSQGMNCYPFDFAQANSQLAALLPSGFSVQLVNRGENVTPSSDAATKAAIINNFNAGLALMNYSGHGNLNVWGAGASIFTTADARALTNGNRLPLVLMADCLNGLFNDPLLESLGEAFLKAPTGGAVATFASSGKTIPDGQQEMSIRLYQLLFGSQSMALGDVTKQAKTATNDIDVRRTWILLGDPSMKIW